MGIAEYFRSISVRVTWPLPGRLYWAIMEYLGVATKFNKLAAEVEPCNTWEEARQAGMAELKRLEPDWWERPSVG